MFGDVTLTCTVTPLTKDCGQIHVNIVAVLSAACNMIGIGWFVVGGQGWGVSVSREHARVYPNIKL